MAQILKLALCWTILESIRGMERTGSLGMGTLEDHHLDCYRTDFPQPVSNPHLQLGNN
jgi:hypothetical protein